MKDQTKIIAALLVGAAAGAALGLLLAPDSGASTRDGIAEYINDLIESAKDKAQTTASGVKDYSNNVYNTAKTKINDLVGDDIIGNIKSKASDIADQAKAYGEDAVNNTKAKAKSNLDDVNTIVHN